MQFVWRDAFESPDQEWVIGQEPILVESRLSEVNKLAATEPYSFERGVLLRKLVREDPKRMIGVEAEIDVSAIEWRKSPCADEDAIGR